MIITRTNGKGMLFIISAPPTVLNRTTISHAGKKIEVEHPFDLVNQAWYNWQMKGQLIQVAFPFLNVDEREFLITGMTTADWDKVFPPKGDK